MKQKIITLILTLLAVFAPLLIVPSRDYSNIGKLIVLLVSGCVLLILLLASYKTLTFDKKDIIILLFMFLVFISTFMSSNIKKSIIGEENRYEGLLMFAVYIIIYLCAKKYFKYEKISVFFNIMFIVSMGIGLLGIAQQYITNKELYPIFYKGVCGTFGNSNFFGSYISLVLPISVATFILNGSKRGFALGVLMFYNMMTSAARSSWIAFLVVGLLGLIYLIKQKNKKYFLRACILLILFVIIVIYLVSGFDFIINKVKNYNEDKLNIEVTVNQKTNKRTMTERKIETIKKEIKQAKETGSLNTAGSGRVRIWKLTLKLLNKKPLLGCGPDNLWDGLVQNCPKETYEYVKKTKVLIDKAHNEYLHIGVTIGIPALICYLIFIALIIFSNINLIKKEKSFFVICLSLISYLVQAFFNISTIGVAPLFWMMLGLIDNKEFTNKLKMED